MYRDQDENLTREQQIERLNEAVAKNSTRRIYETLKTGLQVLFGGLGLAACLFAISFIVQECSLATERDATIHEREAQAAHTQQIEAQEHLQEQREGPRNAARQECATACEHVGMAIERTRVVRNGANEWHPSSCSCASTTGVTRILWNDNVSRETILRRHCREACSSAGLGMQRAVIRDTRLVACGCVSSETHRTLWDDRTPPTCELQNHDNIANCSLQGWNP